MTTALGLVIFFHPWAEGREPVWRWVTIGGTCLLGLILWINFVPEQRVATIKAAKRKWVQAYLETHALVRANEVSEFWVYPPQPNRRAAALAGKTKSVLL